MNFKNIRKIVLTTPMVERVYHRLINPFIDAYIISFPKSGRTWIRMLLAQAISQEYGKKLNLDLYKMTWESDIPNIKTDPRTGNYAQFRGINFLGVKKMFKHKKIIFLVRNPKDVLVSYYYEWTKRRDLQYRGTLSAFIREDFTLPTIINFMNSWAKELEKRPQDVLLITYENLHNDPLKELQKTLKHLVISISDDNLRKAIALCSFENMQKMKKNNIFAGDHRLQAININDSDSFKMRKGKVDGYKEELSTGDLIYINGKLNTLNNVFNGLNYCK